MRILEVIDGPGGRAVGGLVEEFSEEGDEGLFDLIEEFLAFFGVDFVGFVFEPVTELLEGKM
jgi:hypothetical protein